MMLRTQSSLSEEKYQAAKQEAERLGISLAELWKSSLRNVPPVDGSQSWMNYAGIVASGDTHSSQLIDDRVYGHKG